MNLNPGDPHNNEEKLSPKIKTILVLLSVILIISSIAAVWLLHWESSPQVDPVGAFFEKLQHSTDKDFRFDFPVSRDISAGVGLRDWFDSIPGKTSVQSVHAEGVATYSMDPRGDWDVAQKDGKMVIRAPLPELKAVSVDPQKMNVAGPALSAEDRQTALDILQDQMPPLLREDEEARTRERTESIRQNLKTMAANSLHMDASTIQIVFPGEGAPTDQDNP